MSTIPKKWKWLPPTLMLLCLVLPRLGMGANVSKTLRVEHGQPVVLVSQNAVLLLELLKEGRNEALREEAADVRHCRGLYRYRLFQGASGLVSQGEGTVEEVFQTISRTANGSEVADRGSRTSIDVGEFHLGWSEGTAGARSWIYYRAGSGIRFIQQPHSMAFGEVDPEQFRRFLASKNVREFAAAGHTIQVLGPAEFSGDLPTDKPVSARIEAAQVRDGELEIRLSNLATNKPYLIESSYTLKPGSWNTVHSFVAREPEQTWSDPIAKDVDVAFYRIHEGH